MEDFIHNLDKVEKELLIEFLEYSLDDTYKENFTNNFENDSYKRGRIDQLLKMKLQLKGDDK